MRLLTLLAIYFALPFTASAAVHHMTTNDGRALYHGSAVSYERSGNTVYMVTVKHNLKGERMTVSGAKSERVIARVIAKHPAVDLAVIAADIPDNTLPLHRIADKVPPVGSRVRLVGFEHAKQAQAKYAELEQSTKIDGANALSVSIGMKHGASGGAIEYKGELIGIIAWWDAQHNKALGPSLSHVREVVAQVQKGGGPKSPKFVAFSADWCKACQPLQRDFTAGKFRRYPIKLIKHGTPEFRQYHAQYKQRTGKELTLPTVWRVGTTDVKSGYSGPKGLIGWIVAFIRDILIGSPGPPPQQFAQPPEQGSVLLNDVDRIRNDVERLKNGSLFDKIPAFISLKRDVAKAKSDLSDAAVKLKEMREELPKLKDAAVESVKSVKSDVAAVKAGIDAIHAADGPIAKAQAAASLVGDVQELKAKTEDAISTAKAAKGKVEDEGVIGALGWLLITLFGGGGIAKGFADGAKE